MSTVSRVRGDPIGFVRAVVEAVEESDATFVAASLAYYAFVSLIPLLALVVVVATIVGGEALSTEVLVLVGDLLTPSAQADLLSAFQSDTGRGGVTVVGVALTTWGALKLFRGLDRAFGKVYGTTPGGIVAQMKDALLVLVSIGAGVAGVTVVGGVVAFLPIPGARFVAPLSLLFALVAAFFPLYYIFPDAEVSAREALPGTVFAAVCWTLLGVGFGIYATFAGSSAVYGLLGGILLLVTWFYIGGVVLLVGAVLNAVLAGWSFDEAGDDRDDVARPGTGGVTGSDRQVQHPSGRHDGTTAMSESPDGTDRSDRTEDRTEPRGAPDIGELEDEIERLRADLDDFERDVSDRTVEKPKLEAELKRYVRRRMRRGKARGWGPYLVLLYGTAMTIAGFVLLDDLLAMIAMIVIFLSTLGLYVLFVLFGIGLNVLSVPSRARDWVGERRE